VLRQDVNRFADPKDTVSLQFSGRNSIYTKREVFPQLTSIQMLSSFPVKSMDKHIDKTIHLLEKSTSSKAQIRIFKTSIKKVFSLYHQWLNKNKDQIESYRWNVYPGPFVFTNCNHLNDLYKIYVNDKNDHKLVLDSIKEDGVEKFKTETIDSLNKFKSAYHNYQVVFQHFSENKNHVAPLLQESMEKLGAIEGILPPLEETGNTQIPIINYDASIMNNDYKSVFPTWIRNEDFHQVILDLLHKFVELRGGDVNTPIHIGVFSDSDSSEDRVAFKSQPFSSENPYPVPKLRLFVEDSEALNIDKSINAKLFQHPTLFDAMADQIKIESPIENTGKGIRVICPIAYDLK